jgi:hypothetical protein
VWDTTALMASNAAATRRTAESLPYTEGVLDARTDGGSVTGEATTDRDEVADDEGDA